MEPRTEILSKACHTSALSDDIVPWASADATSLLRPLSSLGRESTNNRDTVSGTRCGTAAADDDTSSTNNDGRTPLPTTMKRLPFLSSLSRDNEKKESGYQQVLGSAESTIGEQHDGEDDDDIRKKDVSHMKLHLLLSEHKKTEAADHRIRQGRGEGISGGRNEEYEEQQKRARQRRAILLPAVPQTLPEPEELTVGIPKERVVVRNDLLGIYSQHENVIDLEKLVDGGPLIEKEGEQRRTALLLAGGEAGDNHNHGGRVSPNDTNRTEDGYRGSGIVPLRGMGGLRSMRETAAEDEEEQMREFNQRTTSCTASPNGSPLIFVKDTFRVKVPTANSVIMCPLMKSTESEGDPFSLNGAVERASGRHRSRRSRQETVVEFRHCWCPSHFMVSLVICVVLGVTLCLLFGSPLS